MFFTGSERLLPIQSQARQEPLPPFRITAGSFRRVYLLTAMLLALSLSVASTKCDAASRKDRNAGLRRLTVNAAYWCMQMESKIDGKSCVDIVGTYNPPDSGFDYSKLKVVLVKPSFLCD